MFTTTQLNRHGQPENNTYRDYLKERCNLSIRRVPVLLLEDRVDFDIKTSTSICNAENLWRKKF